MKKILSLLLSLIIIASLAACNTANTGTNPTANPTENPTEQPSAEPTEAPTEAPTQEPSGDNGSVLDGSLEDIIARIYETADLDDQFRDFIKEGLIKTEITAENCKFYFGKDIEFEEALASEPMMSPSAYLLAVARVKDGADIEQIKKDIKDNADPYRWVCVGVKPENVFVESKDNIVILIMSDNQGKALDEAFLALE